MYVLEVEEGSPAAEAGMQAADIIVDVDDTVITSTTQLQEIIAAKNAGDTVEVKVYRVPGLADLTSDDEIPQGEYITMTVSLEVVDSTVQQ